jgi:hypothetical protein
MRTRTSGAHRLTLRLLRVETFDDVEGLGLCYCMADPVLVGKIAYFVQ